MKLREIAHSRTGDKGNTANISVIARDPQKYAALARYLTEERVKEHFSEIVEGKVSRYELPNIGALNFVLYGALSGGVTRTLAMDLHGKSLCMALMNMDIPDDL
ncbi:MAG TPA: hypothetical protein VMJ66_06275 [Geobacteraceae bacterium]|nr:hypothetical protein [Geobacteraceae bacterium]